MPRRSLSAPGGSTRDGTVALDRALAELRRTGSDACRDAYGRDTGAVRYAWSYRAAYSDPGNATTRAALAAWSRALRSRGLPAELAQPSTEDLRLTLGYGAAEANGGVLSVRAAHYIPKLDVSVTTGCRLP